MKITEEEKEKREDVEDGIGHVVKKGMKYLKYVFLERSFNSDILYRKPKNNKSEFFFRESVVLLSMQLELRVRHFELTNEEFLMKSKYMGLFNHYFDKHNTCSAYSCSQFSISFIHLCILRLLLPIHFSNSHFGSSILSLGYYDLAQFNHHLDF